MTSLTLKQAAVLLVRFFGFYLLFYAALGVFDFPGYWLRSSFGHTHSLMPSFASSFDVGLLAYCIREPTHILLGFYLVGQPRALADKLVKGIDDK